MSILPFEVLDEPCYCGHCDHVFVPCILLTGDQVSRRGALTGGYYDTRRSRLDLQKSKLQLMEHLSEQEREYNQHRSKLEELEAQITQLVSKMQTIETKNSKHKLDYSARYFDYVSLKMFLSWKGVYL